MARNTQLNSLTPSKGFTLLELIVTIIIIGVLSVTILPRFFDTSGYEEYTYQAQAITKLRNIQLRAMQQDRNLCVLVDSKHLGLPDTGTCALSPGFSDDFGNDSAKFSINAELAIENNHAVTFTVAGGTLLFTFDKMGRPNGDCFGGCTIGVTGTDSLNVIIGAEGYIRAQ